MNVPPLVHPTFQKQRGRKDVIDQQMLGQRAEGERALQKMSMLILIFKRDDLYFTFNIAFM